MINSEVPIIAASEMCVCVRQLAHFVILWICIEVKQMHFEGIISVPYQAHVAMENCTSCKLLIVEKPYH